MDSLTQFALGAVVSTALLGNRIGPRKAVLVGGVLGTLPDLDILIPYDDPIDTFVLHRGASHALIVHAFVTPLFGEALVRWVGGLRSHRATAYLAVFLCFATHALIDAMTVYGTRLFWPLWPDPVGTGSVFIIDPLYTLPLLIAVVWALCLSQWTTRLRRVTALALFVSTAYLATALAFQQIMEFRAREIFAAAGHDVTKVLALASPFNTILWKVIGLEDDRYHNVYLSLLDGGAPPRIYTHTRGSDLLGCVSGTRAMGKLNWFSDAFLRAEKRDGRIVVADLRMGLTPNYVFQFAVAEAGANGARPIPPERSRNGSAMAEGDLEWLGARLLGRPIPRRAETAVKRLAGTTPLIAAC